MQSSALELRDLSTLPICRRWPYQEIPAVDTAGNRLGIAKCSCYSTSAGAGAVVGAGALEGARAGVGAVAGAGACACWGAPAAAAAAAAVLNLQPCIL